MAQGLQCWDANARLVVDIGDYNMRYVGSTSLTVGGNSATSWSVGWSGMRTTGWLAIMRSDDYFLDYYCIPGTNAFTVQFLPVDGVPRRTITFDVYRYD